MRYLRDQSKKIIPHVLSAFVLLSIIFPSFVYALPGFGADGVQSFCADGVKCGFKDFINLIQAIINLAFFATIPVITIVILYAGYLYMTTSEGNVKQAKEMLGKTMWGFLIMCTAWLGVYFVTNKLLQGDYVKLSK